MTKAAGQPQPAGAFAFDFGPPGLLHEQACNQMVAGDPPSPRET